jgi:hypothetical protein
VLPAFKTSPAARGIRDRDPRAAGRYPKNAIISPMQNHYPTLTDASQGFLVRRLHLNRQDVPTAR